MSEERGRESYEKELVDKLDEASTIALERADQVADPSAKWQLAHVAIVLRDRMRGVQGGTVEIAYKAFDLCISQVQDVTRAAKDPKNKPRYDAVVTEGKQAYETIDLSDTA